MGCSDDRGIYVEPDGGGVGRKKIPFPGDLPIIGGLFRSATRSVTNTELAIFVTPRILSNTGHLQNAREERKLFDQFQIPNPPAKPSNP
jgi:type II secretory pathway component GspD/PulD (secretin)